MVEADPPHQREPAKHKNKASAMKVLKARLYDLERDAREEERSALENSKQDIAFGSQIRSYVLHPYRMVKDLRTAEETSNVDAVLDGDLDAFVKAFLMHDAASSKDANKERGHAGRVARPSPGARPTLPSTP